MDRIVRRWPWSRQPHAIGRARALSPNASHRWNTRKRSVRSIQMNGRGKDSDWWRCVARGCSERCQEPNPFPWWDYFENADTETLTTFVRKTVSDRVSLVATDERAGYRLLKWAYPHEVVKHSDGEYVRGGVHTQNIESFWSLLKRGIMGNYHKVSAKYLPLYLNEFTFRFNNRNNADIFDEIIAGC
ncbi:IS1595 family transposase [Candidatus Binatus sp.]|uniref:IS1595 family transposase n=1 Tax=Candidatus Binatus sp. TaxID=2811406 RepID=UPI003CC5C1BB